MSEVPLYPCAVGGYWLLATCGICPLRDTFASGHVSTIKKGVSAILCGASGEFIRSLSRNTESKFGARGATMWV